ncbi:MFS transporter [Mycobacterium sp. 1423905.2]|uniref:MFS transporter n=1 Tax=Mycobacterium sp. 1423905.2 TaxID=1856859 RepID=UPI00352B4A36
MPGASRSTAPNRLRYIGSRHVRSTLIRNRQATDRPVAERYPAVIWFLLIGNLVVRAAGFAYPFLAYHVAGRGHAASAVGAVLAAFGGGWAVGQLLCGWLVDRLGTRVTLMSTMLVAAAVLIFMAEAVSLPALLVGAAITGVVYDAPRPVLGAAISEMVPDPQRRAKLDAFRFGWVVCIGRAITGGVGGMLVGALGVPVLFWVNAVACGMLSLVAAFCIPARERRALPAAPKVCHVSYRKALADSRLVLLFGSSLATLIAVRGLYAAVPMLMADRGLDAGQFGCAQLANAVAGLALTPVITPWLGRKVAARFRPRLDILAIAGLWTTLSMGAASLAHTTVGFSVATAVSTPGEVAWFVVAAGVVHRIAPPTTGGRYHGIWSMALALASVIAPIVASYSLIHGGHQLVAIVTVAVGLIGAALCLPLARSLQKSGSRRVA